MHRKLYTADSNRVCKLAQLTLGVGSVEPQCSVRRRDTVDFAFLSPQKKMSANFQFRDIHII